MSKDDYKNIVEEYKKVNLDISNNIVAFSLTIIAAVFVICDRYGVTPKYLLALISLVLTVSLRVLGSICFSKHYELLLDKKIDGVDYRNSLWGKFAETFYWIFIVIFIISVILFVAALCNTINLMNSK